MRILGIGTDIVQIARVARVLQSNREAFLTRILTPEERSVFDAREEIGTAETYLAAQWAGKEAVYKALGGNSVCVWNDISIPRCPDSGKPSVSLPPHIDVDVSSVLISLSHESDYAVATAIALL